MILKDKIEKLIEEKYYRYGKIGTETCTVPLIVTEEEKEEFLNGTLSSIYKNYNLDDNRLTILYLEE